MTENSDGPEVKGGLVLKITNDNYVRIGDIGIYLNKVLVKGTNGGKPMVSIRIVAPKDVKIQRCDR